MATWQNHVAIAAPRNGTLTHTVTPSAGTVVAGAAFTPTAGNFLVLLVEAPATSSAPTGWVLPAGGQAVAITGLYLFTLASAAGGDSVTTTHNAANYPAVFHFFEFAAGSTLLAAASATGKAAAGATTPALSGLTGTHHDFFVVGQDVGITTTTGTNSYAWSTGTKLADTLAFGSGTGGTDGYTFTDAYTPDSSATTSAGGTYTETGTATSQPAETMTFAVRIAAGAAAPFRRPQMVRQAVNRAGSF